ncbi:hypothetical protein DMO59_22925 [Salmonella enterica subsp. diarizonae]|nr:hypothetical protein [Salmonella enterica subsp. enterica serovar Poona]ECJ4483809.1 hypothetical protein [Salmonella enterica subsp. diarizonae]
MNAQFFNLRAVALRENNNVMIGERARHVSQKNPASRDRAIRGNFLFSQKSRLPGQGQGWNNHPWLIGSLTSPGRVIVAPAYNGTETATGENLIQ